MFLIREAIGGSISADIRVVDDGEKATQLFDRADADDSEYCPDLVLLDINVPKKNGAQVLSHMRKSRRLANVIVVVVTSSNSARDRETMQKQGANAYFCKPSAYDEFMKLGAIVERLLANPTESIEG